MTLHARFGLRHLPLPKDCGGTTFYEGGEQYLRLARVFGWLTAEPGIAVLTGESGAGRPPRSATCATRSPGPSTRSSTSATPASPRSTSTARSRPPSACAPRIAAASSSRTSSAPSSIAQHLSDEFLHDLASFVNFDFDSRDYLTLWLVGLPSLLRRLRMQHYAALARRVVSWNHLAPRVDRDDFKAMIEHGLTAAGTKQRVLADPAMELLFRASRGIPRVAANLLRSALVIASHRDQSFVDETVMHDAIVALSPEPASLTAPKSREKPGAKSR